MTRSIPLGAALGVLALVLSVRPAPAAEPFAVGTPGIRSISVLTFGDDGVLFLGDSRSGAVFAVDTGDTEPLPVPERFGLNDVEGTVAALLGTTPDEVMIHDFAANPTSQAVYFAVSRGRTEWKSRWNLPRDLADATILLRMTPDGNIEEFALTDVPFVRIDLPNPVAADKTHMWKEGLTLRVDAVTDVVFHEGTLYVSGLSNEEFAATLWHMPFPATEAQPDWATLEIFHGAHGEWETFAPIRTFLPYSFGGTDYVLASYLCTPLVTFPLADLTGGEHVKGHTVAEFGWGNYPMDLVLGHHEGREFFIMANSMLPLMTFTPEDVAEGIELPGITRESPTYSEGVPYSARAGSGVQHLSPFTEDTLLMLQRMPSGKLDLVHWSYGDLAS
jgi:hypothetical protein